MGRPEFTDKSSWTLWSALQQKLQGVNRATRAMEIGTGQQEEHSASNKRRVDGVQGRGRFLPPPCPCYCGTGPALTSCAIMMMSSACREQPVLVMTDCS
jgi:hypothetical protein